MTSQDIIATELLEATIDSLNRVREGWAHGYFDGTQSTDLRLWLNHAMRLSKLLHYRGVHLSSGPRWKAQEDGMPGTSLLACMIDLGRGRKCQDPRDRVYAMLALADKNLGVIPDYSISESALFRNLIIKTLRTGDSRVLHTCGRRDDQSNRASFLPDCEDPKAIPISLHPSEYAFSTATKFPLDVKPKATNMISIRGVRVDAVKRTINCEALQIHERGPVANYAHGRLARWMSGYSPLAVVNTSSLVESAPAYPQISIAELYARTQSLDTSYGPASLWKDKHFDHMDKCTRYRHTFETQQGYLGLGPDWMKPGDQVVIFDGCISPFIIRKSHDQVKNNDTETGERWKLVGDCYLLGWMHGDYFGHPVVDELPSQHEQDEHFAESDAKKYLVKKWIDIC
jgi:hypothetical protein